MNKTRFTTKVLITLLVALMFLGTVSIFAIAGDTFANKNLAFGEVVPTDANLRAQKYSYTFYGDKGDMYFMRLSKGVKDTYFSIEIYSDSKYQNQIRNYSKAYDLTPGNKSLKVTWEFKNVNSGTYYGKCYSYRVDSEGNKTIDSSSLKTFKINIDRITKKTVQLTKLTNTAKGPQISWSPVATANRYYVYRRAAGESGWKLIHISGEKATSYIDNTAQSGKSYTYTVRCSYNKLVSLYDTKGLSILYLSTPVISVNGSGAGGHATVKWNVVTGAKGYYVYRKGGSLSDYTWKRIATVSNGNATAYVDKTATSTDWRYTYTVIAYNGKYMSSYNYSGVNFDYITAPTITRAYSHTGGMRIEWKASNTNITRYYIYRKNGANWKFIGQTTNKYYVDTTAVSGKTYTYTVKALSAANCGGYNAKGITAKFLGTAQINKLTFNTYDRSVVSWKPVAGATGYEIYRKIGNAKNWTLIATLKNPKSCYYYDACKKTSGTSFTYTVRSFDNNKVRGFYDVDGVSAVFLSMPEFNSAQIPTEDGSLCIETKWEAVNGATKYNVYRRAPGGSWILLEKGTTELNYLDTNVECGIKYDYTIRAVNDAGDMSAYIGKSATAITIPALESAIVSEEGVKLNWNAVDNATSYTVYRQAKGSDVWEKLASVETNEYTDITEEGKTQPYYYTVSATFGDIESATYDGIPNFVEIEINTAFVPATEEKASYIDVNFNCENAEKIEVYKSTNGEEPILLENIVTGFEDAEIEEGNTYTYTIVASATGKINGVESSSAKYPHPPLNPAIITNIESNYNDGEPTVTLTWNEVTFADEYAVLRATSDGEWTEIGTVKAETESDIVNPEEPETVSDEAGVKSYSFTDTNAAAEISYGYKIKAVATTSERDSSESEIAQITVYTPLDSVTGIKILPEKTPEGKIKITITWDETKFAEVYTVYCKTPDSEWKEIGNGISGDNGWYYTDEVSINTEYSFKVTATAVNRGSVSNEESFCWTETLTPSDPEVETYLNIVDDGTFVSGKYLVTDNLKETDFENIATAKEGYTAEVLKINEFYGTKSTVNIYKDDELVTTYTLIVKGDVANDDGICDTIDCYVIEKLTRGNSSLEEIYVFAADMDNDGKITIADYNMASALL